MWLWLMCPIFDVGVEPFSSSAYFVPSEDIFRYRCCTNTRCKWGLCGRTYTFVTHLFPFLLLSDTCYVLSFAIIMLNTSLHNPNVRDKPPVERFISMNRGINEGGDLPEELLRVRICL